MSLDLSDEEAAALEPTPYSIKTDWGVGYQSLQHKISAEPTIGAVLPTGNCRHPLPAARFGQAVFVVARGPRPPAAAFGQGDAGLTREPHGFLKPLVDLIARSSLHFDRRENERRGAVRTRPHAGAIAADLLAFGCRKEMRADRRRWPTKTIMHPVEALIL